VDKTPHCIVKEVGRELNKKFKFWDAADDSGWSIQRVA